MAQSLEPVSRLRSLGSLESSPNGTVRNIWSNCLQTVWTDSGTYPQFEVGEKTTMADYVVPDFSRRMRNGEVFFLPMSKTTRKGTRAGGTGVLLEYNAAQTCSGVTRHRQTQLTGNEVELHYVTQKQGSVWSGTPSLANLLGNELSELCVDLSTRVQNDRGRNTEVDVLEDLAEINKTLSIVHDMCQSIRKTVRNKRGPIGAIQSASQGYLIYRYGIRPTVNSLVGVLEGLMKRVGRVRKSTRSSGRLERSSVEVMASVDTLRTTNYIIIDKDVADVRAMSLDEFNASLMFNIGFSPKSLLTLPWELVPYSFVVDWFVNVGEFIGAMAPAIGFTHLGNCLVVRRTQTRTIACTGATTSGTTATVLSPPTGTYEYSESTITRGPLLAASLHVKSDFRFSNATRCLDALALMLQAMTVNYPLRRGGSTVRPSAKAILLANT